MGKSQRAKGAVGEREVCEIFSAALGEKITRNIGQSRDGGNDIDIHDLVVEVKRRKTLGTIYGWLQQAYTAATQPVTKTEQRGVNRSPIVVCRQDGGEWIVVLRLTDFIRYWLGWREKKAPPEPSLSKELQRAIDAVRDGVNTEGIASIMLDDALDLFSEATERWRRASRDDDEIQSAIDAARLRIHDLFFGRVVVEAAPDKETK